MKRTILLGLGLFILSCPSAFASREGRLDKDARTRLYSGSRVDRDARYSDRYEVRRPYATRGKRGRKYARRFSLQENLFGDKLRVYEAYGYTPHRLGIRVAGERFERWKYYNEGLEFVFDIRTGELVSERRFSPENNHID